MNNETKHKSEEEISDKAIEEQAIKKECNWEQMVYFRDGAKWMREKYASQPCSKCEEKDKQMLKEVRVHYKTEANLIKTIDSWKYVVDSLKAQLSEAKAEIERLKQTKP